MNGHDGGLAKESDVTFFIFYDWKRHVSLKISIFKCFPLSVGGVGIAENEKKKYSNDLLTWV